MKKLHQKKNDELQDEHLDDALQKISDGKNVDPTTVDKFLAVDTENIGLSRLDKYAPPLLLLGYVFAWVSNQNNSWSIPGTFPHQVHLFIQALHSIIGNEAKSAAIRDHLPYFLLEASGLWGAIKTLPHFLKLNTKRGRIAKVQLEAQVKIIEGKFPFAMAKKHTAAFVGKGDRTASLLQNAKPKNEIMLYVQGKSESSVYQRIGELGLHEDMFLAFDRGNFATAGEVLLFPIKDEDMFLPAEDDGHDMTLDDIEAIVNVCDEYCDSRKIARKRVVIVGRKAMIETYTHRTRKDKVSERDATLSDLMKRLRTERPQATTEIFDPTEIVIQRIIKLAKDRPLHFDATKASDKRYGKRFYQALEELKYKPKTDAKNSITVRYNIQDTPTEVSTNTDDIAVILDPSRKQSFLKRGISEKNILVVPEIVQEELAKEVNKS